MYRQLTKEDRLRIYEGLNRNESLSGIGRAHAQAGSGDAPGGRMNARCMAHAAAYASGRAAGDAARHAVRDALNTLPMNARG